MTAAITKLRKLAAPLAVTFAALYFVPWNGFTLPIWLSEHRSGRVISRAQTSARVVALTFDDGPDPTYTPRVLDVLKRYGATATFLGFRT